MNISFVTLKPGASPGHPSRGKPVYSDNPECFSNKKELHFYIPNVTPVYPDLTEYMSQFRFP